MTTDYSSRGSRRRRADITTNPNRRTSSRRSEATLHSLSEAVEGRASQWGLPLLVAGLSFAIGYWVGHGRGSLHFEDKLSTRVDELLAQELEKPRQGERSLASIIEGAAIDRATKPKGSLGLKNDNSSKKTEKDLSKETDKLQYHSELTSPSPVSPSFVSKETVKKKSVAPVAAKERATVNDVMKRLRSRAAVTGGASSLPVSGENRSHYTLQVASFPTRIEAEIRSRQLAEQGIPRSFVTEADLGAKGTWYRVRVGGYASRDGAEAAKEELQTKQIPVLLVRAD